MQKNLNNADIVHHLAGITDVARTSKELNTEKDNLINKVAYEGMQNVISSISDNCKIIFPSTHVVYEGIESTKKNISHVLL